MATEDGPTKTSSSGLDGLSPAVQFSILACGVFVFFGTHNVLQEAMMKIPGFEFGVMLGYMEVVGVCVCSFLERTFIARETTRVAPLSAYPLLTFCLLSSSALSNLALNFINFPTKVVFRSCKLIPTMLVASVVNKKTFSSTEYLCALAVCAGLVLFAAADWRYTPSFHPIGLILVTLSVCADAILPNAQERLFRLGSSRLEVTFYTNLLTLAAMTVTTFLSGDLLGLYQFAKTNHLLCVYMCMYTIVAYLAVSMHMSVVKRFGGVAAVVLATARKCMTLILSFMLFPKAFSWFYVWGASLVLGGLLTSSLWKMQSSKAKQQQGGGGVLPSSSSSSLSPSAARRHHDEEEGVELLLPLQTNDHSLSSASSSSPSSPLEAHPTILERGADIVAPRGARQHSHQQ